MLHISSYLLIILLLATNPEVNSQTIAINEIMASNAWTIADEDGDYEDWIELYNYGQESINLLGYGLSDDYSNPFKWIFPEVTIGPGEFLLIWASGKDRSPAEGELTSGLIRDVYTGIPGWSVDDLINHPSYPDHPSTTNIVRHLFEAPINIGDHYGQRIMGWIKAPVSGLYTFWISSDDNSRLYLSTSDDPDDVVMIAHVPGWTNPREWNKYSQQQSAPVMLQAGQYYFVKALMKEHEGGDNLAVGWQLPDGTMQRPIAGEHLFNDKGGLHTNFRISSAGEEVLITSPSGVRLDEIPPTTIPTDISYGRSPDGTGDLFYFDDPTPGESNTSQTFSELLDPPILSAPGGFYTSGFDLTITHHDPEVTIIYTLDGSEPDINNLSGTSYQYKNSYPQNPWNPEGSFLTNSFQSHLYSGPIAITDQSAEPDKLTQISSTWHFNPQYFPQSPVQKGIPVRAIAVKQNALPARSVSGTYFVFPSGRNQYSLPVVSINISENHFYDYEDGIYVAGVDFDDWRSGNEWAFANGGSPANYWRRGVEWEYPAHMELFPQDTDHAELIQNIGVRIHGGWSRSFSKKSLRLYARNRYGEQYFNYPFFPGNPDESFNRLMLRNSGNDADNTLFRDAAIQRIMGKLNFDTQDYLPVIIFINGEYWGIHNFRERYDKHYLARVYGVDAENIDLMDGNASVKEGDPEHYNNMISYLANNDISQPEHYAHIKTMMDVTNFADYNIAQIYARNTDWPGNNIDFWRHRTEEYMPNAPYGHDGRWRWLMYDTDFGFGFTGGGNSYTHNTLAFATDPNGPGWPNPPWSTFVLRRLLTNPGFTTDFINRFADLLNTHFQSSRVVGIIEEMKQVIEPEIPENIHRWSTPGSMAGWSDNVNTMISFAIQRPHHQRNHIRQHFGISSNLNITLDVDHPEHGHIRINTININNETPGVPDNTYPWTGIYFHGIPIEIEAIASPGFQFSHWEGSVNSGEALLHITPESNLSLKAHFIESEVQENEIIHYWHFNDLPSGTFSYVNTDYTTDGVEIGTITYPGTGAGYMDSRTHREEDPVSNLNLLMDQQPEQGAVLRARNPSDTRELIFHIPTTMHEHISVAFATTRTNNGATEQAFYVSTDDGQTWQPAGQASITPLLPDWELRTFNLSDNPEANNNPELRFRILFGGESAGGSSGNNRFDNVSVHGTPMEDALREWQPGEDGSEGVILEFFPNPATDKLYIRFHTTGPAKLSLISLHGQVVQTQSVTTPGSHEITLQTGSLPQGVFLLRLDYANNTIIERVILQ